MPCLLVVVAACSGGAHQTAIGPPPQRLTEGTFSGPLCSGGVHDPCKCRDLNAPDDGGAGVPKDQLKRFEIRLSSPQALWAQLKGNALYKSAEQPDACFYIDLPPGEWPVELRASDKDGAAASWTIHELGTRTKSWYDTFAFDCGTGACSFDAIDNAKAEYAGLKHRGLRDLCGSTKIKALEWATGKAPDSLHPSELLVRLHLDVYKFAPWKPHGDPTCGKGKPPADVGSDAPPPDDAVPPAR